MSEPTVTNSYKQEKFVRTGDESMTITRVPITIAQWLERLNLPCLISTFGLCTIMFWIGAFKFTPTESRQIMVYVDMAGSDVRSIARWLWESSLWSSIRFLSL